jgi:hypothetical protein
VFDFNIGPQGPAETFTISREAFDRVPELRGVYILAYVLYMFVWFGWTLAVAFGSTPPLGAYIAALTAIVVCLIVFIPRMARVMLTMGYGKFWVAGVAVAALFPIPGVLAVAFIDRRISTTWERAQKRLFAEEDAADAAGRD